ncbi:MAG: hypothetical protein IJ348_03935 [Alistipes sp.]|nr:hypothetical protein [Alistipes sp.]
MGKKECNSSVVFEVGELYLFSESEPSCPCDRSLWGTFDKQVGSTIYLESQSYNLREFRLWTAVEPRFKYVRLATRGELRDYMYFLSAWEYRHNKR